MILESLAKVVVIWFFLVVMLVLLSGCTWRIELVKPETTADTDPQWRARANMLNDVYSCLDPQTRMCIDQKQSAK